MERGGKGALYTQEEEVGQNVKISEKMVECVLIICPLGIGSWVIERIGVIWSLGVFTLERGWEVKLPPLALLPHTLKKKK